MTSLQIEVKEAEPAAARLLVEFDLHRGFERERSVADAATARHEGHDRGPDPLGVGGAGLALARAGYDVQDLLRSALQRCPVGVAAADQSLVVAGRNLPADEDQEDATMLLRCDVHKAVKR